MTTTIYTTKALALTAARDTLKLGGTKDPMSGVHFRLAGEGEAWTWHQIDVATGLMATGELIVDGATTALPPLPKVNVIPTGSSAKSKAVKPAKPVKAAKPVSPREAARLAKIAAATAKAAAPKPPKAPRVVKPAGARAERLAAAERGVLPPAPDFTAETHKRFRKTLETLVAAARKGDVRALNAVEVKPISSSRIAMFKYRELVLIALAAQKKSAKAPALKKAA